MTDEKHESTHEHTHEPVHEHKAHAHKKKLKKIQVWQIASGILGILLVVSVLTHGFGPGCAGNAGAELTADEVADKVVTYIEGQGGTATVESIEEMGNLYSLNLIVAGRSYNSYTTKDGNLLFPSGVDLSEAPEVPSVPESSQDLPKTAKPRVDLFIMSYCPYGIQAQQGLYPVMRLLGDDAEFNVKWVPYIMHGKQEIDENTRQYCIQKEQRDKYVDYVECFVSSKNAAVCGVQAGIDEDMVDACIEEADEEFQITEDFEAEDTWLSGRFPIYRVDKVEADSLGVRGSPSMFINGVQYSGARTPEAYKTAICNAFEEPPEECEEALSTSGGSAEGSC
ncbi:DsbA family protein [Candidatus Woesearchaeota archaeon]|nr:DsbA family protein [Candidatus Woesearchaeota archaeon]